MYRSLSDKLKSRDDLKSVKIILSSGVLPTRFMPKRKGVFFSDSFPYDYVTIMGALMVVIVMIVMLVMVVVVVIGEACSSST